MLLHQIGIVHADIKPKKILLNSNGEIKICDFGVSQVVESDSKMSKTTCNGDVMAKGSLKIRTCENIFENQNSDLGDDIWAFEQYL